MSRSTEWSKTQPVTRVSGSVAGSAAQHRDEVNKLALDDAMGAEALLLGRRSYDWFASKFPSRTGALADRLNGLPKYVVCQPSKIPPGTTRRSSRAMC